MLIILFYTNYNIKWVIGMLGDLIGKTILQIKPYQANGSIKPVDSNAIRDEIDSRIVELVSGGMAPSDAAMEVHKERLAKFDRELEMISKESTPPASGKFRWRRPAVKAVPTPVKNLAKRIMQKARVAYYNGGIR